MTFRYLLVHACVPRLLTLARLILVAQFFIWRVTHRDSDSMLLWWVTVVGDFWFAVTWLLNQASKLNPVKRVPDLALLQRHFRDAQLPGLNVFINTVDPVDEPMLYTMNSALSILATDYPADLHATYLSDDGALLVHYKALQETAALWMPFCQNIITQILSLTTINQSKLLYLYM
jgi:mixed-linked glucan synthase